MTFDNRFWFEREKPPEIPPGGLDWSEFVEGLYLAGLADVNVVNVQNGELLVYNSVTEKWESTSPSTIDIRALVYEGGVPSGTLGRFINFDAANFDVAENIPLNTYDITIVNDGHSHTGATITINHADIGGVTANQHHDQQHVLSGSDHTESGLTIGHVIAADSGTAFSWQQLSHGLLGNMGVDDHTQYLLVSGTRPMSGILDMGSNKIIGVNIPTISTDVATKGYVDSLALGLDWQDSVLDKDLSSPLGGETGGERYIVNPPGAGLWIGQDNDIAEYEASISAWVFHEVSEGSAAWVEDEDILYVFNGVGWVKLGSTINHANITNVTANQHHNQVHDIDGTDHTGSLSWSKVSKIGSNLTDLAIRQHAGVTDVTPNQHHNQSHVLSGGDHTASGLTVGHVIRATGATTFAWQQLQSNDLDVTTETITVDIDFAGVSFVDVPISIGKEVREVLRGRLYIDVDPGAAFVQHATYTFYSERNVVVHGKDAFYRTSAKLVYTELDNATTGSDANIDPLDYNDFTPSDLVYLGYSEFARLQTVAAIMIAEDNVGSHAAGANLVRVSEFSGFSLYNTEDETTVYLRVSFATSQTVSLKMELVLRK